MKLRVKYASQLLSHSVAASIFRDVSCGTQGPSALATAHLVKFCDQLFDSFNGTKDEKCKPLRKPLTSNSPHHAFWDDVIEEVDGWKIESSRKNQQFQRPPSQNGVITTINGYRRLWNTVKQLEKGGKKIKYLVPRNVNQDALENTFGAIRSNCGSNWAPTVEQFVGALKTCIINGLAYSDVKQGTNCEVDGASLFKRCSPVATLASGNQPLGMRPMTESPVDNSFGVSENSPLVDAPKDLSAVGCVSGYIAKRL